MNETIVLLFLALATFEVYRNDKTEIQKWEAKVGCFELLQGVDLFIEAVKIILLESALKTRQSGYNDHMAMLPGLKVIERELALSICPFTSLPRRERLKFCCLNRVVVAYEEE